MTGEFSIVLCGVGGQGILFATNILYQTALAQDLPVIGSETHGMAQRGGSVVSHVKIGPAESPLVRRGTCDFLFIFQAEETGRYLDFPREKGLCFINSGIHRAVPRVLLNAFEGKKVKAYSLAADKMALAMEAPLCANLILLGFASPSLPPFFSYKNLDTVVKKVSPRRLLKLNRKALRIGLESSQGALERI